MRHGSRTRKICVRFRIILFLALPPCVCLSSWKPSTCGPCLFKEARDLAAETRPFQLRLEGPSLRPCETALGLAGVIAQGRYYTTVIIRSPKSSPYLSYLCTVAIKLLLRAFGLRAENLTLCNNATTCENDWGCHIPHHKRQLQAFYDNVPKSRPAPYPDVESSSSFACTKPPSQLERLNAKK